MFYIDGNLGGTSGNICWQYLGIESDLYSNFSNPSTHQTVPEKSHGAFYQNGPKTVDGSPPFFHSLMAPSMSLT